MTKKSEAMRKIQIPPFKHKNRKIKMIPQAPFKFLFKPLVVLIAISFFINSANAQGFLTQKDLSQFKVEMLSEADISKIKERIQSSELTIDQIKTQSSAKGLPAAEFEKLRTRLSATNNTLNNIGNKLDNFSNNRSMQTGSDSVSKTNIEQTNPIFGSELFQTAGSMTSNANIATPLNYEVGPNDILKMVIPKAKERGMKVFIELMEPFFNYAGHGSATGVDLPKIDTATFNLDLSSSTSSTKPLKL